jgi:hypothetical protein
MSSPIQIVCRFLEAQRSRDEVELDRLAALLADDITLATPMGSTQGKAQLAALMRAGSSGGIGAMLNSLQWGSPTESNGKVCVRAETPASLPLPYPMKGIELKFAFTTGGRISRIELSPHM